MITPDQIRNNAKFGVPLRADVLMEIADRLEGGKAEMTTERDAMVKRLMEMRSRYEHGHHDYEVIDEAIAALSDTRRLALEECKAAIDGVMQTETMSKHTSVSSCSAARSAILKCYDAVSALAAQPERKGE